MSNLSAVKYADAKLRKTPSVFRKQYVNYIRNTLQYCTCGHPDLYHAFDKNHKYAESRILVRNRSCMIIGCECRSMVSRYDVNMSSSDWARKLTISLLAYIAKDSQKRSKSLYD